MIYISHRGNINGKNPEMENNPDYINNALKEKYNVEIDVWYIDNTLYLGHDEPQYKISHDFLLDVRLWCHAKNYDALFYMLQYPSIHCFWHQDDDLTLTSKNFIWTYPGKDLINGAIAVLPEIELHKNIENAGGICSDFIENYKK